MSKLSTALKLTQSIRTKTFELGGHTFKVVVPLNKELEDVTQRIINVPKEEVAARLEKMTKSLTEVKLDNDTWLCLYTGEVFCK